MFIKSTFSKLFLLCRTIPVLVIGAAVGSCTQNNDSPPFQKSDSTDRFEPETKDTIVSKVEKKDKEEKQIVVSRKELYSRSSRRYTDDSDSDEDDNMRHFDPSMEDDMDDNGMSRYMEANDDEAWD